MHIDLRTDIEKVFDYSDNDDIVEFCKVYAQKDKVSAPQWRHPRRDKRNYIYRIRKLL